MGEGTEEVVRQDTVSSCFLSAYIRLRPNPLPDSLKTHKARIEATISAIDHQLGPFLTHIHPQRSATQERAHSSPPPSFRPTSSRSPPRRRPMDSYDLPACFPFSASNSYRFALPSSRTIFNLKPPALPVSLTPTT